MSKYAYALYRGDEFITVGTTKEIAAYAGIKVETVHANATPKRVALAEKRNRTCVIRIDEIDEYLEDNMQRRNFTNYKGDLPTYKTLEEPEAVTKIKKVKLKPFIFNSPNGAYAQALVEMMFKGW